MSRALAFVTRERVVALVAGGLPVLAFPRAGLDWLAWVALAPGLLVVRAAPVAREAAVRGWWFGFGFLVAATYWLVPSLGPGLALFALVMGALWAGWALAVWALLRPPLRLGRALVGFVLVPSAWVSIEWVRSWHGFGGPWALLGASQWRHPAVLGLAAVGGVWLVSLAVVAVNTAVTIVLVTRYRRVRLLAAALAVMAALAGPMSYALRPEPLAEQSLRLALVQPGVVRDPALRFAAGERITAGLPPADLVVWGESSVGFDLARRPDLVGRLVALAAAHHADLLVNEDARDAAGRISKSSVLVGPDGVRDRYVKSGLVPFGEYVPLRRVLGWLTRVSRVAEQDRVPGTGVRVLRADYGAAGTPFGPLVCFESTFPDLGRAVVRRGARLVVYQSATSTFQGSWAPPQHASVGAVRAAETGRPVVQAALTGVSAAYDARGRRLAWLDTARHGSVVVRVMVPAAASRTPYDRYGDYVPFGAMVVVGAAAVAALAGRRRYKVADTTASRAGTADLDEAQ